MDDLATKSLLAGFVIGVVLGLITSGGLLALRAPAGRRPGLDDGSPSAGPGSSLAA